MIEMDGGSSKGKEKKRRPENDSGEGRGKKIRSVEGKDDATEEEVEEFFAILRRMQEAVKYFERESGEGWRAALEAEMIAEVGKGSDDEEKADEPQIEMGAPDAKPIVKAVPGVLDLNAIPEAESSEM